MQLEGSRSVVVGLSLKMVEVCQSAGSSHLTVDSQRS